MRVKKPYLSVVIPAYNASVSLVKLLHSLRFSRFKNFEVIVGDDASFESMEGICNGVAKRCFFPVTFVRLKMNQGPAGARNAAAKKAKGTILVFLDSDVEVYPDTLLQIANTFQKDEDLTAITGVWDKEQKTQRFFPQFKALRDWSYWTNERDRGGYYYLFSTRIAALRRRVFERLGGFNVSFRQMEDVEITYRIARRYAIIFSPRVRVHHEFEDFWAVSRKYFWRSFYWTKLYAERRKFDPVATTLWESIAALTAVGSVGVTLLAILIFFVFPIVVVRTNLLGLALVLFLIHIFLIRKFLFFVQREKGWGFMLLALATGIALYISIFLGSLYSFFIRMRKGEAKI
jgi:glycosyltransferase involved in cell wall biosynthesis